MYKGYFHRPVTNSDGHCGFDRLCPCHPGEEGVEVFERPLVFDIEKDPAEKKPLPRDSKL